MKLTKKQRIEQLEAAAQFDEDEEYNEFEFDTVALMHRRGLGTDAPLGQKG